VSVIQSIYGTLSSDIAPAVGSVTPTVRNYNNLRDSVKSVDTPVRLLLTTTGESNAESAAFITMGKLQKISWTIEDLLLWKPAGEGEGLSKNSEKLVDYMAAYAEAIRQKRQFTAQSHVTSVRMVPGIYAWPEGSGNMFFGVRCFVRVEEIVSGS